MPRARNIKPAFFTNDELAECEPLARLMFIGLWSVADREGRLLDRPKKIKAETLPYDNCDADNLLNQLHKHGFIQRYEVDNIAYIQVVNFTKHQNCHVKESASTIPAPCKHDASTVKESLLTESFLLNPESPILNPESVIQPSRGQEVMNQFDIFWQDYPTLNRNKGSKKDADAKFKIAIKKATFDEIMEGLRKYTEYIHQSGQSNQDAFRWLEKERWADDYTIQQQNKGIQHGQNNDYDLKKGIITGMFEANK